VSVLDTDVSSERKLVALVVLYGLIRGGRGTNGTVGGLTGAAADAFRVADEFVAESNKEPRK
jgi:hypothetical protein